MRYHYSADKPLTKTAIKKFIDADVSENARKIKLHDYYKGKHAILQRRYEDASKPNNKVVNPYARYITTLMTGYFIGEPIAYTSENEVMLDALHEIYAYSDEPSVNKDLAKNQSIFGVAYEIMYIDSDGNPRFKALPSEGMIMIYGNDIEEELIYAIRYWEELDIESGNKTRYAEVYSATEITRYKYFGEELETVSTTPHLFGQVPVNAYYNNAEEQGDFELVISEIDAYDSFESDSVNEADYFADSYLTLSGMEGTTAEDISNMKSNRVLVFPEGGSASWLNKQINDTWIENEKKRLDADIHKFSFCPAMTDEAFAQNASGVAMRYKLMGLENAVAVKETEFKKGLRRRIELIYGILKKTNGVMDYLDINIVFTRNIPQDLASAVDTINKLDGVISDETRLSLLPLDIDVSAELDAVAESERNNFALFPSNFLGGEENEAE